MGDQLRHLRLARPCFACHLDRGGVLFQRATGIAQPRPMHTGATIELPAATADLRMFLTMIEPTDGARLHTDRADGSRVHVTFGQMLVTKTVLALLGCQMVGAQEVVAEIALSHALLTAFFITLSTMNGLSGELPAARTVIQTFQTVSLAAAVALIETRADLPATF